LAQLNYQNRDDARRESPGILRSLFGPSKREVWNQLAQGINATYVDGGFFGRDKVVATTGQWTVTLDTFTVSAGRSSTTYTRMRAPYVNKDGFWFRFYRAGLFTPLGEILGLHDIKIGEANFDDAFVLKANDEQKVRQLLSNPAIKQLMNMQPQIRVEVKDDEGWFGGHFPQGVDELYFVTHGVIKDIDRLEALFDLFSEILHQLCHIGSAYENDPGVELR
jgi:hypothetical protein